MHSCHEGCSTDNCGVQYTDHFYDDVDYDPSEDEDFG